jgi:hypothetical protein
MALYLARYLNVLPASLPGDGDDRLDALPVEAGEFRAALLDTFDREQQIDEAACLVARHLSSWANRLASGLRLRARSL